jgi:hypothetical protein
MSAAAATGPITPVPNGSIVMSSANRRNPDLTSQTGGFGWDVLPGFYQVRAGKHGWRSSKGQLLAHTPVFPVPPPVDNIVLKLQCPAVRG